VREREKERRRRTSLLGLVCCGEFSSRRRFRGFYLAEGLGSRV